MINWIAKGSIIVSTLVTITGLFLFIFSPTVPYILITLFGVIGVVISAMGNFALMICEDMFEPDNILDLEDEEDLYSSIEGLGTKEREDSDGLPKRV